jgi:radical SAM enzyme (TIGR01210 family)
VRPIIAGNSWRSINSHDESLISLQSSATYPSAALERERWIIAQRPQRNQLDAQKPYAFFVEQERADAGEAVLVATIFLTNRECPWKCVFCDLWKNTLTETVPSGAIPAQIGHALASLPPARQIKLYNGGSFFDPQAVPPEDYAAIATRVAGFERVIVECHPNLVKDPVLRFRDLLRRERAPITRPPESTGPVLEIAMGLETVHVEALEKLNKRMTLEQFRRAAEFLVQHHIAVRVFILVQPPFVPFAEAALWVQRSIDFAFDCGAGVCTLIPTRGGNGALDALARTGQFSEPRLHALEEAAAYGIARQRGRVFADLWDLERFSSCNTCFADRLRRLREMNDTQRVPSPVGCNLCGGSYPANGCLSNSPLRSQAAA